MQPEKKITCLEDLPDMPTTIDTMRWNETGTWRFLTPLPVNKIPPCRSACPAGMPIPDFINAMKVDGENDALSAILTSNPLPGLTSNLCYHPCQPKCVRRKIDGSVSIQEIERHIASYGVARPRLPDKPTVGKVAVVGSGPVGLACAYFLKLSGIEAAVFSVGEKAGGALWDISASMLDHEIIEKDIDRLTGIVRLDHRFGQTDLPQNLKPLEEAFDVVILDPTAGQSFPHDTTAYRSFDPYKEGFNPVGGIIAIGLPATMAPFKPALIAHYIGSANMAAKRITAWYRPEQTVEPQLLDLETKVSLDHIKFGQLISKDLPKGARNKPENLSAPKAILCMADRCLSCGTCNLCGQCLTFCPEASILLKAKGIAINLYHCKGCGICSYECPRGVITMEDENSCEK